MNTTKAVLPTNKTVVFFSYLECEQSVTEKRGKRELWGIFHDTVAYTEIQTCITILALRRSMSECKWYSQLVTGIIYLPCNLQLDYSEVKSHWAPRYRRTAIGSWVPAYTLLSPVFRVKVGTGRINQSLGKGIELKREVGKSISFPTSPFSSMDFSMGGKGNHPPHLMSMRSVGFCGHWGKISRVPLYIWAAYWRTLLYPFT